MAYFIFFGLPVILLIIGFPIFLILLVTSIIAVLTVADVPTEAIQTYMFGSLDNFPLLAVPFFVLAGEIMAQGDQQGHHGIPYRDHRLRDDERKVRRLAALVEIRQLDNDRPGERGHRHRARDQDKLGQQMKKVAHFRRQHGDDDVHADLASFPGDRTAAGEHTANHEEEHDLFRPGNGDAEKVTTDDIGKIDRHAGDQTDRRRRAGECQQPAHTLEHGIDHGLVSQVPIPGQEPSSQASIPGDCFFVLAADRSLVVLVRPTGRDVS